MNQVAKIQSDGPVTKGTIFKQLHTLITVNNYQLPDYIYRADMIPEDFLGLPWGTRQEILEGASMRVGFEYGYPAIDTFEGPSPLWEKLPGEDQEAYEHYLLYLELPEKSQAVNPIRLLPMIATMRGKKLSEITDLFNTFFWHWRSRAYDLFLIACQRKAREQRMLTIEGQHFEIADKILTKVVKLTEHQIDGELSRAAEDPNYMSDNKLKDLVGIARDLVTVQRISVGLPANGVDKLSVQMDGPRYSTPSETFKHLANEAAPEEATQQRSPEMDELLKSTDDLSTIQELIIRTMKPLTQLPAWSPPSRIHVEDAEVIDVESNSSEP